MFTYRDDSGDEEVQLLASPRSCYACERGVRFPELNQQGVSILDRPRSALSPGTVKRAEIWTPEKAKEVSKELVLARESRTPKRRPFSASVSVATRNRMKPGGASLADSPSMSLKHRPKSAFSRPSLLSLHGARDGGLSPLLSPVAMPKGKRSKKELKTPKGQTPRTEGFRPLSPIEIFQKVHASHEYQYPISPDGSLVVYTPSKHDAFGPLCRALCSPHSFDCICGLCFAKEEEKRKAEEEQKALEMADILKGQEAKRLAEEREKEIKRKQEERKKDKALQEQRKLLRQKAIYQSCKCFHKNEARWKTTGNAIKHLPNCPIRQIMPGNLWKKEKLSKIDNGGAMASLWSDESSGNAFRKSP